MLNITRISRLTNVVKQFNAINFEYQCAQIYLLKNNQDDDELIRNSIKKQEFAEKLLAKKREIHAITVIADYCFDIEKILKVGKNNFSPPPKVDSIVLRLIPKKQISKELMDSIEKLFSQRRKTISNIAKSFGKSIKSDKRLEELETNEIIDIAKQI